MSISLQATLELKDDMSAKLSAAGSAASSALGAIVVGTQAIGPAVKGSFDFLKGDFDALGNMLGAIPGPIGQVAGAIGSELGKAEKELIDYSAAMTKAANVTGTSVSFMSQFVEAADDQFVSQEAVIASLNRLSRGLGGAMDMEGQFETNGKGVAGVLRDMGIATEDANGKAKTMQELLPDIANKFQEYGNGAKSAALAQQLFGKQGIEMLPVLTQGWDKLNESMQAAGDSGLAITDETAAAVHKLKQAEDALNDSQTAVERQIAAKMIPAQLGLTVALNAVLADGSLLLDQNRLQRVMQEQLTTSIEKGARAEEAKAKADQEATEKAKLLRTEYDFMPQSIHAMIDATDAAAASVDNLVKHTDGVTFQEYDQAAEEANTKSEDLAAGMRKAQQAADDLKRSEELVAGVIGKLPGVMDNAAKAQLAYELATGKTSVADVEKKFAAEALFKAYNDGKLTLEQYTQAEIKLAEGNPAAAFYALKQAGLETDPVLKKNEKDLLDVEKAAGVSKDSVINFGDGSTNAVHNVGRALQPIPDAVGAIGTSADTSKTKVAELNGALMGLPPSINAKVNIIVSGLGDLQAARALQLQLGSHQQVDLPVRDVGGPGVPGQAYRIGVPEIFVPATPGRFIPLGQGGAGAGITNNITIQATVSDNMDIEHLAWRIAEVIKRRMQ